MDRRLRVLSLLAIGLVFLAALMVATKPLAMPSVSVQTPAYVGYFGLVLANLPVQLLVLSTVLQAVAFSYLIAGVLHLRLTLRFIGLAVLTVAALIDTYFGSALFRGWEGAVLLAGIWGVGAIGVARDRKALSNGTAEHTHHHRVNLPTFLSILGLVLAWYGLSAWRRDPSVFGSEVAIWLVGLSALTTPMFFRAGSDFGDLASVAVDRLEQTIAKWSPVVLAVATALAAATILGFALYGSKYPVWGICFAVIFLAFGLTLTGAVRPNQNRALQVPVIAVVIGCFAFFVVWDLFLLPAALLTNASRVNGPSGSEVLIGRLCVAWLLVAVINTILLIMRKRLRLSVAVGLVYLAITGMWFFLENTDYLVAVVGELPNPSGPHLGLSGLQATVAILTLIAITYVIARRQLNSAGPLLTQLLALNAALQVLALIVDFYSSPAEALGAWRAIAPTVVVLIALLTDVALSGAAITNRGGRRVPRHASVLLYLGYILLVTAALVFFSGLSLPNGASIDPTVYSDQNTAIGVGVLGVPLFLTVFFLAQARRRTSEAAAATGNAMHSASHLGVGFAEKVPDDRSQLGLVNLLGKAEKPVWLDPSGRLGLLAGLGLLLAVVLAVGSTLGSRPAPAPGPSPSTTVFEDDFSNHAKGWDTSPSRFFNAEIQPGLGLHLTARVLDHGLVIPTLPLQRLTVAESVGGNIGSGDVGASCRQSIDRTSGYQFWAGRGTGVAYITRLDGGTETFLVSGFTGISWQQAQQHVVTVTCDSDGKRVALELLVDGNSVLSATDTRYLGPYISEVFVRGPIDVYIQRVTVAFLR